MAEWQGRPLGDLLSVQNGHAFNSKQFSGSEGMPLIRIRDLTRATRTATRYRVSFRSCVWRS